MDLAQADAAMAAFETKCAEAVEAERTMAAKKEAAAAEKKAKAANRKKSAR